MIILAGAAVLLLAGGGGGLYASGMLGGGAAPEQTAEEKAAEEAARQEAARGTGVFVQLDPMTAPIMVDGRLRRQVAITFSLEVRDNETRGEVARILPRLRDAMLQDLYAAPVMTEGGLGQMDMLNVKSRMLAVARQLVGTEEVIDVLVVRAVRMG
jgi:flagellar basal body-associated protein FliL